MPTDDYARAKGWHVFRQYTGEFIAGEPVWNDERALCPDHSGNQKRQAKPVHLEGEQPLW